ncbi:STE/STE20 protein kinase [Cryptococcus neoformans C23]|uniref:STE/STE20/Fray protein kinase n=1 Tax=Cryptococcus neoformans (strain H99 / ATCC 208821 / CBS 10515 / FGSC 9487) TaxID=235443 RepID=J9VFR9_CRYN9|nr:STE/STE20/Fray protein kinase [Cryptococcus neoformans var. grubii H99]AUB22394.1 STE/STE20/Fray protein kinase [Cryptococcus neoformans var. grubii]OWZ36696.1 STE/STE20 protein kinase [Cryptococcus neoformans var. grubii AD2-60a]OWZ48366.1 STE/STE20 protein kinase [Cryptococcus neoformans var. grubii C23]OXC86995.1 STE/STE20 protein kinase [Cryptococcus neoformans var. grubii AD1-7a]AFR92913.2 STE/STE20/Fray protein kinase [Cryptococcus neoformans var. grubii H99]|eukprot:XP_012046427.1 STE/STE20/Fray protein kinase [Cryptococcus neoformans var. grubii H99]
MENRRSPESRREDIPARGMLNDEYWSTFTFNSDDYELGPIIGFGASSTVYAAVFTPPSTQPPTSPSVSSTSPNLTSTPQSTHTSSPSGTSGRPHLSIALPAPSILPTALTSRVLERGISSQPQGNRPCAIKVSNSHLSVEQLFKEIRLLALCKHPNILRILATFTLPPDCQRIALVTPLISGGSLAGILDWRSRLATTPKNNHVFKFNIGHKRKEEDHGHAGLEEEEIKTIIKQVLEGLKYLHEKGYLHRDLKAGNLLIDDDGTILLADLGVGGDMNLPPSPVSEKSRRKGVEEIRFGPTAVDGLGPGKAASMTPVEGDWGRRKSFVGTPNWMAPEVILGRRYDSKADIWSLGITVLELAYGSVPGSKNKGKDILARIITDPPPTLDRMGKFSRHMKEFVDSCLIKDPGGRPTSAQLLEHHWLKGVKKKAFLAQSLLDGVPQLAQRQELCRMPTVSSFVSLTSSWDFPTPSHPSSPVKSTLNIPSVRSPSVISYKGDYFASHTHSRSSSFSVMPPSPRVSLRQWAERSASVEGEYAVGLGIRTGSERGKTRSSSATPAYSARKTTSFDLQLPMSTSSSSRAFDGASPMRRGRELWVARSEDSMAQDDERATAPMSPLMEVGKTEAHPAEIPPLNLNESLAGLEIRSDGCKVLSSPELLPTGADEPEIIAPAGIPKETSTEDNNAVPSAAEDVRLPETEAETSITAGQTEYASTDPSDNVLLSRTETILARISSRTANSDHSEKRSWFSRRSSVKKAEKVLMATFGQEKDKGGLGNETALGHSHSIGKTGSWGAVFDKMTAKKGKR